MNKSLGWSLFFLGLLLIFIAISFVSWQVGLGFTGAIILVAGICLQAVEDDRKWQEDKYKSPQ